MAFDFPAAPILDQTYTAHGVTYRWNGYAWVQIGSASGAPIDSPAFTGNPTAPTPPANDNDTSIATTAFVQTGLSGKVSKSGDTFAGGAVFHWAYVSPGAGAWYSSNTTVDRFFVGTDAGADNFRVYAAGPALNALSIDGATGKISVALDPTTNLGIATKQYVDARAPIASPVFTGDPQAPTPATADNDTSIATTAFVKNQGYAPLASPTFTGDPKAPTPLTSDNDTSIATTAFVKAQGYVTGGPYAPLADPTFTGDPKAPTPATADNDTSIATTAFVKAQGYITSSSLGSYAPLNSPVFTGNPTAPTPGAGDNDTSVATTAFVQGELAGKVSKTGDTMSGTLTLGYMSTWPFYVISNNAGTNPAINQGLAIGGNYTGGSGEVDFIDTNISYTVCFNFYQMTGATTKNLLASILNTGEIVLGTNPSNALGAATKQMVDAKVNRSGDTMGGTLTTPGTIQSIANGTNPAYSFQIMGAGGVNDAAYISFHRPGVFAAHFGLDYDNQLKIGGWSWGGTAYRIIHEGVANPTVSGDPTTGLGIATKQYVDGAVNLSSAVPAGLGAGSPGSATTISRSDHVHPSGFRDYAFYAGGDLNTLILQGYYEVYNPTNAPADLADSWCLVKVSRHSNSGNQYLVQHATTMTTQPVRYFMRSSVGNAPGTWSAWQRILDNNLIANAQQYIANATDTSKIVGLNEMWNAGTFVTLTDGATVTPDLSLGINFAWALGGAGRTLANPINFKPAGGQSGIIAIGAGASGTVTGWGTSWKFSSGVKPVLTPNGVDLLCYTVRNNAALYCTFIPDVR